MSEHLDALVKSVTKCRDIYTKSPLLKGSEGVSNLLLAVLSYLRVLESRISKLEFDLEMRDYTPGDQH